jgi:hypothetical protein
VNFFLGTHRPHWLWTEGREPLFPLFVSHITLDSKRALLPALGPWALDSGAFSIIAKHGSFDSFPAKEYIAAVRRYFEMGNLQWAAPQDWMCEEWMLKKTGLSIIDHQRKTVASYVDLMNAAPDLPWIPVLQGWTLDDYRRCADLYYKARIYLDELAPVGIGSVCRRQGTGEAARIIRTLAGDGFRLHAFGFKAQGIERAHDFLESADSMAWSRQGRYLQMPGHPHKQCNNCPEYASVWRGNLMRRIAAKTDQLSLPFQS